MKKALLAIVLSISLCNNALASGVPVVDAALAALTETNFYQEFANMVQQLEELQKQVETAKNQLETAKNQLNTAKDTLTSMTDTRNLTNLLESVYTDLEKVTSSEVLSKYGIHAPEGLSGDSAEDAQESIDRASEWLARVEQFEKDTSRRHDELKKLAAKSSATTDIKESMDLNARISAELAIIQNEQLKATLAGAEAEAKKGMEDQKKLQRNRERIFKRTNIF